MCYYGCNKWAAQSAANIPKEHSNTAPSNPTDYKWHHTVTALQSPSRHWMFTQFLLGLSASSRKETINCVLYVRLSVRLHETIRFTRKRFHEILFVCIFRNTAEKPQVSLKSDNNKGNFTWRPIYIYYILLIFIYLQQLGFHSVTVVGRFVQK
jgi:hypothetical protein